MKGLGGLGGFEGKANCPSSPSPFPPELDPLLDLAASGW